MQITRHISQDVNIRLYIYEKLFMGLITCSEAEWLSPYKFYQGRTNISKSRNCTPLILGGIY